MAIPYQDTNPYNLPASAQAVIPQELGQDFLSTLGRSIDLQEQKSRENLLGFQESRGLLRSGDTNKRLVEDVLGPYDERRRQALLGIAVPAAMRGQEQGFQERFATSRSEQQLHNTLAEMERKQQYEKELIMMQEELMRGRPGQRESGPTASQMFMKSLFPSLGAFAGQAMFGGAGGLFGGLLSGLSSDQGEKYWSTDYSSPVQNIVG